MGVSGSGKSFAAEMEILMSALFSNDDIIVIDVEREYGSLIRNLGGEVITLSASSKNHIDALEINNDIDMDENPVSIKSEFLISLFDQLLKSNDSRLGGGEFVCISESNVLPYISQFKDTIYFINNEKLYNLSVSIGYSRFHEKYSKSIDDIICRADEKMYMDKKSKKTEKRDGKINRPEKAICRISRCAFLFLQELKPKHLFRRNIRATSPALYDTLGALPNFRPKDGRSFHREVFRRLQVFPQCFAAFQYQDFALMPVYNLF